MKVKNTVVVFLWLVRFGFRTSRWTAFGIVLSRVVERLASLAFVVLLLMALSVHFTGGAGQDAERGLALLESFFRNQVDVTGLVIEQAMKLSVAAFAIFVLARFLDNYFAYKLGVRVECELKRYLMSQKFLLCMPSQEAFTERLLARAWLTQVVKARAVGRTVRSAYRLIPDLIVLLVISGVLCWMQAPVFIALLLALLLLILPLYILQNYAIRKNEESFAQANARYKEALKAEIFTRVLRGGEVCDVPDSAAAAQYYYRRDLVIGRSQLSYGLLIGLLLFGGLFWVLGRGWTLPALAELVALVVVVRLWLQGVQDISLALGNLHKMQFHMAPLLNALLPPPSGSAGSGLASSNPSLVDGVALGPMRLSEWTATYYAAAVTERTGHRIRSLSVDVGDSSLVYRAGEKDVILTIRTSLEINKVGGVFDWFFDQDGCHPSSAWGGKYRNLGDYERNLAKAAAKTKLHEPYDEFE